MSGYRCSVALVLVLALLGFVYNAFNTGIDTIGYLVHGHSNVLLLSSNDNDNDIGLQDRNILYSKPGISNNSGIMTAMISTITDELPSGIDGITEIQISGRNTTNITSNISPGHPKNRYVMYKRISGELGNGMNSYANLLAMAKATNRQPVIGPDCMYVHAAFDISLEISRNLNYSQMTHFRPPNEQGIQHLIEQIKGTCNDVAITSWFGEFSTFENVTTQLRQEFTFRKPIQERMANFINNLDLDSDAMRIGVHVRGGDMNITVWRDMGLGTPPVSYFVNAMNYFRQKYDKVVFVICSDSPGWVKTHINGPDVYISIDNSREVDLAILSSSDHVIIGQGTFGWWAGWLCRGTTVRYLDPPRKDDSVLVKFRKESQLYPDDELNKWIAIGE